jgi:hypothetical protein
MFNNNNNNKNKNNTYIFFSVPSIFHELTDQEGNGGSVIKVLDGDTMNNDDKQKNRCSSTRWRKERKEASHERDRGENTATTTK